MHSYKFKLTSILMLMIFTATALGGCGGSRAKSVKHSGFLGDYSMLKKTDKEHHALYNYKNPKANWPSYSKILLDPIMIWRRAELRQEGAPIADLQRVANNFYFLLKKELSKDYEMVQEPGPRTIRIQVALTDVQSSWAAVDTITSITPIGIGLSAGQEFITGKPAWVGEVSTEFKVTDARTGKLLAAGVDRRVGGNEIEASVDDWDDVNRIIEIWSKMARYRLCMNRGGKGCLSKSGI